MKISLKYNELDFSIDIKKVKNKIQNVLIIGGAGTIGSNYLKTLIKNTNPKKIIIVDINENGLTELTRDLRSSNLLDYYPFYLTYPVNLLVILLIKFLVN